MKFVAFAIAGLVLSVSLLRADLTITQKVEGLNGVHDMVIEIKGDMARVEATPQITTIINSKTGEICTLMNDKKEVLRISPDKAKAMAAMVRQFNGRQEASTKAKLIPTGRKETINGYPCEEYRLEGGSLSAIYWITTKNSDYRAILDQLDKMQPSTWDITKKGMPDYADLPGLPIRVIVKVPAQGEVTTTLVSIKQDSISPERFVIPSNYHEMQMPDFSKFKPPVSPAQEP